MPTKKKSGRQPTDKKTKNQKASPSRADAKMKTAAPTGVRQGRSAKTSTPKADKSSNSHGTKARRTAQSGQAATTTRKKKSTRKTEVQGLIATTSETLDTMVAGAIIGAVTGAARNLAHEPSAMPLCDESVSDRQAAAEVPKPTTGQVLEEMAPGAAFGAVSGTAKAVMTKVQNASGTKGPKKSKR